MLEDTVLFFLLTLTLYRLCRLVSKEDGPFELFKRLRQLVGRWASRDQEIGRWYGPGIFMAELLHCPFCLGIWLALPLALIYFPTYWYLYWFALAGGQAYLQARG